VESIDLLSDRQRSSSMAMFKREARIAKSPIRRDNAILSGRSLGCIVEIGYGFSVLHSLGHDKEGYSSTAERPQRKAIRASVVLVFERLARSYLRVQQ
jgi:hypothetical protein